MNENQFTMEYYEYYDWFYIRFSMALFADALLVQSLDTLVKQTAITGVNPEIFGAMNRGKNEIPTL